MRIGVFIMWQVFTKYVKSVPFIVSPSTAALSYRRPASAGHPMTGFRAQGHHWRYILYLLGYVASRKKLFLGTVLCMAQIWFLWVSLSIYGVRWEWGRQKNLSVHRHWCWILPWSYNILLPFSYFWETYLSPVVWSFLMSEMTVYLEVLLPEYRTVCFSCIVCPAYSSVIPCGSSNWGEKAVFKLRFQEHWRWCSCSILFTANTCCFSPRWGN